MTDYAFEGPKWSTSVITWSYAPAGGSFSGAISIAYQATIEAALARWTQVTNVTFSKVVDSAASDIRIGWAKFTGSQVGQTDYSYQTSPSKTFLPGVKVTLEDPSAKSVGTGLRDTYQGTSTTLYEVVLHEIGHALGLDHSTDPTAVMYAYVGPNNADLGASDILGIQALYGSPAAGAIVAAPQQQIEPVLPATISLTGDKVAVYRFFDRVSGTQFLTASADERNTVIATRPDLAYEGLAMAGLEPDADPEAVPIYRYFDTRTGTHFFTASQDEQRSIAATRPDLVLEQTTFYEHATQQADDTPVYRFFDLSDGTHFFTASASERTSVIASRPDLAYEGVAFYAPASA